MYKEWMKIINYPPYSTIVARNPPPMSESESRKRIKLTVTFTQIWWPRVRPPRQGPRLCDCTPVCSYMQCEKKTCGVGFIYTLYQGWYMRCSTFVRQWSEFYYHSIFYISWNASFFHSFRNWSDRPGLRIQVPNSFLNPCWFLSPAYGISWERCIKVNH